MKTLFIILFGTIVFGQSRECLLFSDDEFSLLKVDGIQLWYDGDLGLTTDTWTAETGRLIVHRVAGTTSNLAYSYMRIK